MHSDPTTGAAVTTHVLDIARGRPAPGVLIRLEFLGSGTARILGEGTTDAEGRCRTLVRPDVKLSTGPHRLTFDTASYFESIGVPAFYPAVEVIFVVTDAGERFHLPLLLSPFGYSTYRGS